VLLTNSLGRLRIRSIRASVAPARRELNYANASRSLRPAPCRNFRGSCVPSSVLLHAAGVITRTTSCRGQEPSHCDRTPLHPLELFRDPCYHDAVAQCETNPKHLIRKIILPQFRAICMEKEDRKRCSYKNL